MNRADTGSLQCFQVGTRKNRTFFYMLYQNTFTLFEIGTRGAMSGLDALPMVQPPLWQSTVGYDVEL